MAYIHSICGSNTNQVLQHIQPTEEKAGGRARTPPISPELPTQTASYPPFKLGSGSFFDAEVPRGQNESRGRRQGHGADSRVIHTEGGFRNVCRRSQLHVPHGLQTGRKAGQVTRKVQPCFPAGGSGPSVLVGSLCCRFYREQVPH